MKVICFTRPDGGMSFILPAPKEHLERVLGPLTDEAYWAHIYERNEFQLKDAANVHECEHNELPHQDRDFRNAWGTDGVKVAVNMPKARGIHKENLRRLRAPKLAALDVEYQRADEEEDAQKKQSVAVQKKVLRDVTDDPRIEASQTTAELRVAIPDVLKG